MPDAKYAETRRMAEVALRESAGVDLVADWQAAALSVCRTVLDAPHVAETPKQEHEAGDVPLGAMRALAALAGAPACAGCDYVKSHCRCATAPKPAPQPAAQQGEPFGYFRAEPFGWTDCAESDEGAVALYEKAGAADATLHKIIAGVEAALDAAGAPAVTLVERIGALGARRQGRYSQLDREQQHAIRQAEQIGSSEAYFKARPQIDYIDRRNVFESAFERGWDARTQQEER